MSQQQSYEIEMPHEPTRAELDAELLQTLGAATILLPDMLPHDLELAARFPSRLRAEPRFGKYFKHNSVIQNSSDLALEVIACRLPWREPIEAHEERAVAHSPHYRHAHRLWMYEPNNRPLHNAFIAVRLGLVAGLRSSREQQTPAGTSETEL